MAFAQFATVLGSRPFQTPPIAIVPFLLQNQLIAPDVKATKQVSVGRRPQH